MTYGRPTMTVHLPALSLPSTVDFDRQDPATHQVQQPVTQHAPTKMCFYVEYIRQCRILGEILSKIYQSSQGVPSNIASWSPDESKTHGLDAILDLDAKLTRFERDLDPVMSWRSPRDLGDLDPEMALMITTQRNVLHGR